MRHRARCLALCRLRTGDVRRVAIGPGNGASPCARADRPIGLHSSLHAAAANAEAALLFQACLDRCPPIRRRR